MTLYTYIWLHKIQDSAKTKILSKHKMSRFSVSGFRTWFVKNTYFNKIMPSPTLLLINRILKSINIVFKNIISKLVYLNIWNNALLKTLKNIFIDVPEPEAQPKHNTKVGWGIVINKKNHHYKLKLHEGTRIKQYLENESPKNLRPHPKTKKSPHSPRGLKMTTKKHKIKVRKQKSLQNEIHHSKWVNHK